MNPSNQLDTIYYIKLPEDFSLSRNAMRIDPEIPLPVQKKAGDAPGTFKAEELTQEQILAGILTVLAYDKHNEHSDYHRSFFRRTRKFVPPFGIE